jgi:hypothetical protein
MPNGGSDCCGTCPFNGVNKGVWGHPSDLTSGPEFRCEIRGFQIADPFWTYCNNHPRRNPLWRRTPRGPVWAAVFYDRDSKPLREGVVVPPHLLPPVGDAMYVRVPYLRGARPETARGGACELCGESPEESIRLDEPGRPPRSFCSVAHYLERWLQEAEEAKAPAPGAIGEAEARRRAEGLSGRFGALLAAPGAPDRGAAAPLLEALEDLLAALPTGRIDPLHAAIYLEQPDLRGSLPEAPLSLQVSLHKAAMILQGDCADLRSVLLDIEGALRRMPSGGD